MLFFSNKQTTQRLRNDSTVISDRCQWLFIDIYFIRIALSITSFMNHCRRIQPSQGISSDMNMIDHSNKSSFIC